MKKTFFAVIAIVVLLVASTVPGYSDRGGNRGGWRGGHGSFHHGSGHSFRGSVWIGPGWGAWGPGWWGSPYSPYYYPYPYYPYNPAPPVVIERQQPPVYVQPGPEPEEQGYWYYCQDPQGYYPYVKQCPDGWMKVVPTPPDEK